MTVRRCPKWGEGAALRRGVATEHSLDLLCMVREV